MILLRPLFTSYTDDDADFEQMGGGRTFSGAERNSEDRRQCKRHKKDQTDFEHDPMCGIAAVTRRQDSWRNLGIAAGKPVPALRLGPTG